MIIGNKTATPRALFVGDNCITIPPMGFVTLSDDAETTASVEELKNTAVVQQLIDMNILCFNKPNVNAAPTYVEGPKPPEELVAESAHERVTKGRPKHTKETMKV